MVPVVSLAQIFPAFPKAPTGMLVEHAINGIGNFGIAILRYRMSIVGRPRQADTATTALYGHVVLGNQISYSFTLIRRP
jgi:hypothetical protein